MDFGSSSKPGFLLESMNIFVGSLLRNTEDVGNLTKKLVRQKFENYIGSDCLTSSERHDLHSVLCRQLQEFGVISVSQLSSPADTCIHISNQAKSPAKTTPESRNTRTETLTCSNSPAHTRHASENVKQPQIVISTESQQKPLTKPGDRSLSPVNKCSSIRFRKTKPIQRRLTVYEVVASLIEDDTRIDLSSLTDNDTDSSVEGHEALRKLKVNYKDPIRKQQKGIRETIYSESYSDEPKEDICTVKPNTKFANGSLKRCRNELRRESQCKFIPGKTLIVRLPRIDEHLESQKENLQYDFTVATREPRNVKNISRKILYESVKSSRLNIYQNCVLQQDSSNTTESSTSECLENRLAIRQKRFKSGLAWTKELHEEIVCLSSDSESLNMKKTKSRTVMVSSSDDGLSDSNDEVLNRKSTKPPERKNSAQDSKRKTGRVNKTESKKIGKKDIKKRMVSESEQESDETSDDSVKEVICTTKKSKLSLESNGQKSRSHSDSDSDSDNVVLVPKSSTLVKNNASKNVNISNNESDDSGKVKTKNCVKRKPKTVRNSDGDESDYSSEDSKRDVRSSKQRPTGDVNAANHKHPPKISVKRKRAVLLNTSDDSDSDDDKPLRPRKVACVQAKSGQKTTEAKKPSVAPQSDSGSDENKLDKPDMPDAGGDTNFNKSSLSNSVNDSDGSSSDVSVVASDGNLNKSNRSNSGSDGNKSDNSRASSDRNSNSSNCSNSGSDSDDKKSDRRKSSSDNETDDENSKTTVNSKKRKLQSQKNLKENPDSSNSDSDADDKKSDSSSSDSDDRRNIETKRNSGKRNLSGSVRKKNIEDSNDDSDDGSNRLKANIPRRTMISSRESDDKPVSNKARSQSKEQSESNSDSDEVSATKVDKKQILSNNTSAKVSRKIAKKKTQSSHSNDDAKKNMKDNQTSKKIAKVAGSSKQLQNLQKIARACGIFYARDYGTCDGEADKIQCVKQLLRDAGMTGKFSMKAAETIRLRKEAQELDSNNIITPSPGRGRSRRKVNSLFSTTRSSPEKPISKKMNMFAHLKGIVDSEESSDSN